MLAKASVVRCVAAVQDPAEQSQAGKGQVPQSRPQQSSYRSLVQDSQDYQSEEDVDRKFVELERQTLESMMQTSAMRSDPDSQQGSEEQQDQRRSSGALAGTSGTAGTEAEIIKWWRSASDRLEQLKEDLGSLEVHQAQAMAKDVTTILTRMINARVMRGQDPKVGFPPRLLYRSADVTRPAVVCHVNVQAAVTTCCSM